MHILVKKKVMHVVIHIDANEKITTNIILKLLSFQKGKIILIKKKGKKFKCHIFFQ